MTSDEIPTQEWVTRGPWQQFVKVTNAICQDGRRRTAHSASVDGVADTFFSIPAFVYVGSKRVYGYVTSGDDGYEFRAYLYRKNHALIRPTPLAAHR